MARGIDFRQEEVVNIKDGTNGAIKSIVVAKVGKLIKSLGGKNNITIPWNNVKLIGEDVILVEI